MIHHEQYMKRCFELAANGLGSVAPNPLVGCVIVHDGKIISEAWHQQFGEAHAEVNAINALGPDFNFSDCALYVNLEPCSHYGKTPPCSDLLVSKRFKKVVICNADSNPLVAGKGIEKLKKAGIEVHTGILEKEGRELNKRFFTFYEKKRPYIILKWAQTADGFISRWPLPKEKSDNWITSEDNRILVHLWRSQEQAIMVGENTVRNDDPELTVRLVHGKNPVRIVLDEELKLDPNSNVFNDRSETLVFTGLKKESKNNIKYFKIDFSNNILAQVLRKLYELNISSVLVEGGGILLQNFIKEGLWDEARIFVNPDKNFGQGIKAPDFDLNKSFEEKSGTDYLFKIKNPSQVL